MKDILVKLLQKVDVEVSSILAHIQTGAEFISDTFDSPVITSEAPERGSPLRGRKGIYIFVLTADINLI